jgi:hypothetical protein
MIPSIHRIGGWKGNRAGLDGIKKSIFLTPQGLETLGVQPETSR